MLKKTEGQKKEALSLAGGMRWNMRETDHLVFQLNKILEKAFGTTKMQMRGSRIAMLTANLSKILEFQIIFSKKKRTIIEARRKRRKALVQNLLKKS